MTTCAWCSLPGCPGQCRASRGRMASLPDLRRAAQAVLDGWGKNLTEPVAALRQALADSEDASILQPNRVIVGHCPSCWRVIVILNDYGTWPVAQCACGWASTTHDVAHRVRFERDGVRRDGAPG